ncbi:hypothetical protein PFLUV_G00258480 [Perca fluviatilis]|uniref:Uncharacterized protein n=1 Tax=Perca fluviatilis TaxID=8168 RepID=A0A6A5DZJ8_PERFL|nr:uncharacterized protein LOC120552289 [Perca fluviatilis]KAF1373250.1 hypothetical protein PFLUV_G00258480 [Perca fluviatilis]
MAAATSTFQHSFGLGPRGPNPPYGAQQAPGPSGASRPEEQHHKPFFYIQPSQPYMPMQSMQWPVPVPMPVSYNPYAYPGLGYGMPMMPHYQPNPYMEPPGFVVPHTHLHLMDYRRMLNPQYYQTMAYQSRRFRYQHHSQTRETTSSEVQTEPLPATQRTSTPGSSDCEAPSGVPVCSSDDSPSAPFNQPLLPALAVQTGDHSLELKDMAPSSTTRTAANGGFVIQTEEVRIECCTTPVGLQLLHSHETAEVSHSFSQDGVQCSSSVLQGHMLQDEGLCLPADKSEQALQSCPDILLVGMPSSGEKISALEESRNQTDSVTVTSNLGSRLAAYCDDEMSCEKDLNTTSNFKVVHLPFDPEYLDELWKMESTVWSMEETLIPSPESLILNGRTEYHNESLAGVAGVPSADVLMEREEVPTEEFLPMTEMPSLAQDEQKDMVPTGEKGPGDEIVSEAVVCPVTDVPVAEKTPMTELTHEAEVALAPNLPVLDNSPPKANGNQHRRETDVQHQQDTSFESLPTYLPSTSWMADFDNVHYCNKMPPTPKKQNRPLSSCGLDVHTRRRKLELEYKEQHTVRKPKERYKHKGKVDRRSLSDHECCLNRNFNENAFTYASKRERLCSRCVAKSSVCTSASPGPDGRTLKRKAALVQQWNDSLLPTCEACKSHSKKRLMRKGSGPDVCGPHHGHDTEGESSENGSCHLGSKWRAVDNPRKLNSLKRPLASKQNVEKCPAAMYPKLREKNCVCNEPQLQSVGWERLRHCPHGNAIREMDENCAMPVSLQDKWRIMDQIYLTHRWQTGGKSRKAVMPNPDGDGFKNEARSTHFNHKKSQPQSQGTRRNDTRC